MITGNSFRIVRIILKPFAACSYIIYQALDVPNYQIWAGSSPIHMALSTTGNYILPECAPWLKYATTRSRTQALTTDGEDDSLPPNTGKEVNSSFQVCLTLGSSTAGHSVVLRIKFSFRAIWYFRTIELIVPIPTMYFITIIRPAPKYNSLSYRST